MTTLSLAEYRALPHAQRNLTNWRRMSDAGRGEYLESGGANAPINNPAIAEAVTAIDPAIAATVERMAANYKLAQEGPPMDASVAATIERIRSAHEAVSGFKRSSTEHTDG
jgi:hypothetical protein